jgi:hypothetical protein
MRRKKCHTYHYSDDKICELCHHSKITDEYGSDVFVIIDNEAIYVEDPACNNFKLNNEHQESMCTSNLFLCFIEVQTLRQL